MERLELPSSLILIWDLKRALESGQSVQAGVLKFMSRNLNDKFSQNVKKWFNLKTLGLAYNSGQSDFNSAQKILIVTIQRGLEGLSIYETLKQIEKEFLNKCEDDIQLYVSRLPLIMLAPLMLFIMPSIFLLLVGPALQMLSL